MKTIGCKIEIFLAITLFFYDMSLSSVAVVIFNQVSKNFMYGYEVLNKIISLLN